MVTDTDWRTSPDSNNGPRKSAPTSVRGHSATQYVACHVPSIRTTSQSTSPATGHGHVVPHSSGHAQREVE